MKMPQTPRSVRDILNDHRGDIDAILIDDALLVLIKRYNDEYLHWDELRYRDLPMQPEVVWLRMKIDRRGSYEHVRMDGREFRYMITRDSQRILHILDKGASGGVTSQFESLDGLSMDRYILSSLMEEAIASSQLEGAVTTRRVAKEMLRSGRRPANRHESMIYNNYLTMQEIKGLVDEPLTPRMICDLHRLVTNGTMVDDIDEGRFRGGDDIVVADPLEIERVYHVPPPHDTIPSLIDALCEFVNEDGDFIHPLVKAIIIHFMIGFIHPFVDGNGRLGRTLMYWYAMKNDYWMFEYMAISKVFKRSKKRYGLAYLFMETDENDLTYFINFNLRSMEESLQGVMDYIDRKANDQREALEMTVTMGLNCRQASILKDFVRHEGRFHSVKAVAKKYGVSDETARNDLNLLTEVAGVRRTKVGKRSQYFL